MSSIASSINWAICRLSPLRAFRIIAVVFGVERKRGNFPLLLILDSDRHG